MNGSVPWIVLTPVDFLAPGRNILGTPEVAAISELQQAVSMQVTRALSSDLQAASLSRLQARSGRELAPSSW